ncbi:hypothetical protein [Streptomyces sp. NPDC001194]|uniref:hypothetical protein n=1 Tax=Streptomyces sp. NPDC001194 TaxID=3364547 RepID=UPI003697F066
MFDEQGRLLPPFKESRRHKNAKCFTGAAGTLDPNAWRCIAGNQILDPCWYKPYAAPDNNVVACVSAPWDRNAVILETPEWSGPSSNPRPTNKLTQPWAIEIRDPAKHKQTLHCVWVQGTGVQEINGMRLDWACHTDDQSPAHVIGYALGLLNRSHPLNTVPFAPAGSSEVRDAEVTAIWP